MAYKKARKATPWIRRTIQIVFFVIVALIAVGKTLEERGIDLPLVGSASLHAVCPFGGVVSFYQFITDGTLVKKVHESSLVLSGLVLILLVLFGPVFCGWLCPLGSVQEWVGKLGKKLFKKRYNHFVPIKLDRVLRYLRYLVFIWVSYMTIVTGTLVFEAYDPYFTLFQFWTGEVAISGFIVLGATLLLSLFVERPFCKYACPFGAFQGIFNLFRIFGIKRRASSCINCKLCDKACPMNIEVSTSGVVRDHQCISCLECTSEAACPVADTVVLAAGRLDAKAPETVEGENASAFTADGGEQ